MIPAQSPRIVAVRAEGLAVPLAEPFVIATSRVDVTPNVLVEVTLSSGEVGFGEAATLPEVTRETPADVLAALASVAKSIDGHVLATREDILQMTASLDGTPVAKAGLEAALLDAFCQRVGCTTRQLLAPPGERAIHQLVTDITLPILERAQMLSLARSHWAKGFRAFKVKVGKNPDHDLAILLDLARAHPQAELRLDANGGFSARQAIDLVGALKREGVTIACFEQPTAREDTDALGEVAAQVDCPVIADESVRSLEDVDHLPRGRGKFGVNLKLVKLGGFHRSLEVGRRARERGMLLMVGGMVETRLGMSHAAQLAAALGGVAFCDLDTAFLLADDPFVGGYAASGPELTLSDAPGVGVKPARRAT